MSAKGKLKRIALPLLYRANSTAEYSLRIIYNLQFEESNFWFDIYSFISLAIPFSQVNADSFHVNIREDPRSLYAFIALLTAFPCLPLSKF